MQLRPESIVNKIKIQNHGGIILTNDAIVMSQDLWIQNGKFLHVKKKKKEEIDMVCTELTWSLTSGECES